MKVNGVGDESGDECTLQEMTDDADEEENDMGNLDGMGTIHPFPVV